MATSITIDVQDNNLGKSMAGFLRTLLESRAVDALMAPLRQPGSNAVMPCLVSDPKALDHADLLSPTAPLSAARMAARLTRKPGAQTLALILRPCEIRAYIELVKLNQAGGDGVILVAADCAGVMSNKDFAVFAKEKEDPAESFWQWAGSGEAMERDGFSIAPSCRACDQPIPREADLCLGVVGTAGENRFPVMANTEKGEALLDKLDFTRGDQSPAREQALEKLVRMRKQEREALSARTLGEVGSLASLSEYFTNCVNCYNCRVACPVCYCRECVFCTDAFDHEASLYLQRADRNPAVRMPVDTEFFHLTRLAHMSTSCVGCGQCSNACPNDIPVADLFRVVSAQTQEAFGYRPGHSWTQKPPLAEFEADEFQEVVGVERKAAS